jgi:hypothetical protein
MVECFLVYSFLQNFLFLGSFLAYLSAIFIFTFLLHSKISKIEKLERMSEFAVVAYFKVLSLYVGWAEASRKTLRFLRRSWRLRTLRNNISE